MKVGSDRRCRRFSPRSLMLYEMAKRRAAREHQFMAMGSGCGHENSSRELRTEDSEGHSPVKSG